MVYAPEAFLALGFKYEAQQGSVQGWVGKRSVIKPVEGIVDIEITHIEQVHALGKDLAQQAIGVLIGAALPGVGGPGEIDPGVQALADKLVLRELLAQAPRRWQLSTTAGRCSKPTRFFSAPRRSCALA